MKNALILHGARNNSQGNWFPWLKNELEAIGYTVWAPDLPNSEKPIRKDWINVIFSNPNWQFNEKTVLVGHSAGAILILRILEELPVGITIDKAVLVAGPINLGTKPEFFQYKEDLVKGSFNWEKIKKSAKHFYFFYSDNDPYQCGSEHGILLQQKLGGELLIRSRQGHFNLEISPAYKQFPELLKLILLPNLA